MEKIELGGATLIVEPRLPIKDELFIAEKSWGKEVQTCKFIYENIILPYEPAPAYLYSLEDIIGTIVDIL